MRRSFTIDDVVSFPFSGVGGCHLSLDGKRVAYSHRGTITIFDVKEWCPETSFDGAHARWSPADPNVLAYVKSDCSGIFIRHVDGTERHLGESIGTVQAEEWAFGHPNTLDWSFDGKFLAMVVERDSAETDISSSEDTEGIEVVNVSPDVSTDALVVLDVSTGAVTFELFPAAYETYWNIAWHPSGDWLTVVSNGSDSPEPVDPSDYSFETGLSDPDWHLYDIDVRNGQKKSRVGPSANEMGLIKWSPDGTKLALGYSPYVGEVRPLCALMERDSNQIEILSEEYYCNQVLYWAPDSRKLYVNGLKGLSERVVCVDTVSKSTEEIVDWTGRTSLSGVSQDGQTLLIHWRGLNNLSDVYVVSIDSGESKAVTHFTDQLNVYELPTAEVVEWPSYDGLVLQGVVVSPHGQAMSPDRPTIVDLHGGPIGAGEAISQPIWNWLVSEGFQVFAPDFRGSQQYQFAETPAEDMNYRDVMSGIEWLAQNGKCDPTKMGLTGFSYGAYLGSYVIGQTSCFRAAVISGADYGYMGLFQLGLHVVRNAVRENDKWKATLEIPDWYFMQGIYYADRVETPVLLFQGEHDIPPIEAKMYATYLSDAGTEVEYVMYRGEGHLPISANKDRLERMLRWFRKYLME